MKKRIALLLSVVILTGIFAGCGSAKDKVNETSSEVKTSETEKTASEENNTTVDGEDVVLTLWYWDSNIQVMIDAFTAQNPNVTIEVVEVAASDIVTKLQQALASGSEIPDIIAAESSYRGQLLGMDIWEDLTEESYGVTDDMFLESALGGMQNPDGKIVAIEECLCPSAFAYKRDVAKEWLGTDDPDELEAMFTSVDDMVVKAEEVAKASNGEVKMFVTSDIIATWLSRNKGICVENEDGEVIFTEKFRDALEYVCKFRDVGGIDVITGSSPQDMAAYGENNYLFYPAANWAIEYWIKPNDPDGSGNWGMFTPPGGGFSWGGTALGVSKDSQHKQEAWEFIKYFTMTEEGVNLAKEAYDYYTVTKEYYEDPEFFSNEDEFFGGQDIGKLLYGEIASEMAPPIYSKYDGVCSEVQALLTQNIMADSSYTVEQALEDGLTEVQNKLPDVVVK